VKTKNKRMIERVFDIEVYPNLFSLACKHYKSDKKELFVISPYQNDIKQIVEWIETKNTLNIGHNVIYFDNLLLAYILKHKKKLINESWDEICFKLKKLADRIIKKERNAKWDEDIQELFKFSCFKTCDTLSIMNTVDRAGLKQISVNLKYWNVEELPFHPDTILSKEEIDKVLNYNFNDVEISCLLYEKKQPDLELRKDVSKRYNLDVMNANDTAIAKNILNKYYEEATKIPLKEFKDLRSFNKEFYLKELMPEIEFKTKPFQNLKEWFKLQLITEKTEIEIDTEEKKAKIKYDLILSNLIIRFALGGCHSQDTPGIFKSDDTKNIIDFDFSSWYPNLLINYKVKPRHVKAEFIDIIKKLTLERIEDKKAGRKKDADVKKIVINSIYGLLGSEYYWLRDIKALLKVTITGQLWLAKLVEELIMNNIQVISVNTDGVLSIVKNEQKELYESICNQIAKDVNVEGEYSYYKKYIRLDVNNYISIDTKDKTKQKGKYFQTELALNKGYYYPIIAKALNNYYINSKPIEETIKDSQDIFDFICSQKVDTNKFNVELHTVEGLNIVKTKLQKINRWVISKIGGKMYKIEKEEANNERIKEKKTEGKKLSVKDLNPKSIGIEKESILTIVNKIENKPISEYKIDYQFYIQLCNEIISEIEPKTVQTTLF